MSILGMILAICMTVNGGAYSVGCDKIDNCRYIMIGNAPYVYSEVNHAYIGYSEVSDKPYIHTNKATYEAYMCFSTDKHNKTLGCKYLMEKRKYDKRISDTCKAKVKAKYKKVCK